jgi:nitronate monooxygenase
LNAKKGNLKNGFAFAGENAYRATSIVPLPQLIDTIQEEFEEAQSSST